MQRKTEVYFKTFLSKTTETGKENGQKEKWRETKEYKFIVKNNVMWVM